jgi:biopolymer transport protein ExbB
MVVSFIKNGGFMMYPLILCSIILIAIGIERAISLRKAATDGDGLLEEVKKVYGQGTPEQISQSVKLCERTGGAVGRIFARGLKNAHRNADAIEMAMEQEAANEQPALEANLSIIKTIVNIAPLLGLLGTIAGMIGAFRAASQTGLSSPTAILGGISEALISTATGITLAVIGFIFFNYFSNVARKVVEDMEYYGSELVNFLTGRID